MILSKNISERPSTALLENHPRPLIDFVRSVSLVVIHSILVLLQAITLNVAFNSKNKMLLIIMITNNVSLGKAYFMDDLRFFLSIV